MAGLKTKPDYAGAVLAASLGLALLKKCKVNTWAELGAAIEAGSPFVAKTLRGMDLGARQLQALADHGGILDLLRVSPPSVPAFCSECGEFFLTSDTAPAKCMITSDCTGKPAKVTAANAAPGIPEDDSPDQWAPEEPEAADAPEPPAEDTGRNEVLEPDVVPERGTGSGQYARFEGDLGEASTFSEFTF